MLGDTELVIFRDTVSDGPMWTALTGLSGFNFFPFIRCKVGRGLGWVWEELEETKRNGYDQNISYAQFGILNKKKIQHFWFIHQIYYINIYILKT